MIVFTIIQLLYGLPTTNVINDRKFNFCSYCNTFMYLFNSMAITIHIYLSLFKHRKAIVSEDNLKRLQVEMKYNDVKQHIYVTSILAMYIGQLWKRII